jgi:hypothetical protein
MTHVLANWLAEVGKTYSSVYSRSQLCVQSDPGPLPTIPLLDCLFQAPAPKKALQFLEV